VRILVSSEDDLRAYRDVIAAGIRIFRPHVEVEVTSLEALDALCERLDPHLVICSGHAAKHSGRIPAWVELSIDTTLPSKISVGGQYSERINPTLEVLLSVIDEVEELIQTNYHLSKS
jgi:hypothetical protein